MVNLLAIETSGEFCSVCLDVDGTRFCISEHAERKHNEMLLPMLGEIRRRAGLDPREFNTRLDAVAFGRGPGSFTGIRIAASAAQAIALAGDARVLRVSCSQALALAALVADPDAPGVVTFIRSRRDLYHVAAYRNVDGRPADRHTNQLEDRMPERSWLSGIDDWILVGERPSWWTPPWRTGVNVESRPLDAGPVLDLGREMFERGEDVAPAQGLPDYPEGDAPWRKSR